MNPDTDATETVLPPPSGAASADEPPAAKGQERPMISSSVGKAAWTLGMKDFSNGDRATLRRVSPDAPFTPALWRMLYGLEQKDVPSWFGRGTQEERLRAWERRWATLLMGMAFCVRPQEPDPQKRHLHDYEVPLGRALVDAGWSELRFVRLLRSTGEALEVEVRRVAQRLASASQPANWADVAHLLFNQPSDASSKAREIAERCRLSIARDYYGTRHKREQENK